MRLRLSSNPLSLWCPESVGLHVSRVAVSEVTSERRRAFPREPPRPRGHPGNLPPQAQAGLWAQRDTGCCTRVRRSLNFRRERPPTQSPECFQGLEKPGLPRGEAGGGRGRGGPRAGRADGLAAPQGRPASSRQDNTGGTWPRPSPPPARPRRRGTDTPQRRPEKGEECRCQPGSERAGCQSGVWGPEGTAVLVSSGPAHLPGLRLPGGGGVGGACHQ